MFSQCDGPELKRIVKRNTQWICLAHGMLHYYGAMGVRSLMEKIENLIDQKIDMLEFMHVMSFACDFYGQLCFTSIGFHDRKILKPEHIIQEQKMRSGLVYYAFSRKQLMDASDPDFIDKTPEMDRLIRFIRESYEISSTDLNEIILRMTRMIKEGTKLIQIMEYLQSRLAFPSFEFAQELTEMVTGVNNSTRQWVLKGHSPDEVFQEERKHLKPLPKDPIKSPQEASSISNPIIKPPISKQSERHKVGRNELCPCGSGKKFKKCCGN